MAEGGLRFTVEVLSGKFRRRMRKQWEPIARTATNAMREAANIAKERGRGMIRGAGFSQRWANSLRVNVYPERGYSIDAAIWVYHRIPYAGVFDGDTTIQGSPYLWLPLPSAPVKVDRKRVTPRRLSQAGAKLISLKTRSGKPLLGVRVRVSKAQARNPIGPNLSLAAIKRGGSAKGVMKTVPLFFGVRSVTIKRKLNIERVMGTVRDEIPRIYNEQFKQFLDD